MSSHPTSRTLCAHHVVTIALLKSQNSDDAATAWSKACLSPFAGYAIQRISTGSTLESHAKECARRGPATLRETLESQRGCMVG
jgi:hypothetical protein